MAWARIKFLTPQAKISCPRGFATWARIFAFGVKNFILALAIGWESYILHCFVTTSIINLMKAGIVSTKSYLLSTTFVLYEITKKRLEVQTIFKRV